MSDLVQHKSMSKHQAFALRLPLLAGLARPLVGLFVSLLIIAFALSMSGPGIWGYLFSQTYTPRLPDFQAFSRLPAATLTHIAGATTSFVLGAVVLFWRKGTAGHKLMGRIWVAAMVVTAVSSFFLKSFAPLVGQFGPIHLLSIWTMYSLPRAIWFIRRGDVEGHLRTMRGLYWGLCIAGAASFIPGRALYLIFFG